MKRFLPLLLILLPLAVQADPRTTIEQFQDALLAFASGDLSGYDERYARLEPVVEATHDLDYIARLAIGRHWPVMTDSERDAFASRFRRLAVANYAARFPGFDGERFEILGLEPQPRGIVLVRTRLYRPGDEALDFDYMMRETGAGWRIVNILVNGVSDLALKRAEYAAALRDGGMDRLLARLDDQIDRLQE